jgi:hypothetical protein
MNKDDMNPQLTSEQSAVDLLDNKAKLSLYNKSSQSGIPVNVLEEVFMRGYASWDGDFSRNPIQVAFNRVNSFIAGGYASQLDEDLKQACWKDYEAVGMKEKNGKKVPNCVPVKEGIVENPMKKPELPGLAKKTSQGLAGIGNRGIGQRIAAGIGKNAPQPIQNMKNPMKEESVDEATYQGRSVELNKPMQGDVKKSKVYVKDPSTGNVKKVNFGDKTLSIKKDQPDRKKSYCARSSGQGNLHDKTSANYWSRKAWDCSEETVDEGVKDTAKKVARTLGTVAALASPHVGKAVDAASTAGLHAHDAPRAALTALTYAHPSSVALAAAPSIFSSDKLNSKENEFDRQKKYAAKKSVKEESKLLNKPTLSAAEIAKKFDVPVSKVDKSIKQGTKVEKEHTKSTGLAKEIARDHLGERPDYYKKLANMEKSPVKEEEVPTTKRRLLDGTKARADWLKSSTPGQTTSIVKKTVKEALKDV